MFTTGFLGGFGHCIGMCGPVVTAYSLNSQNRGRVMPHIFYNLGRITTYSIIGGFMGLTGSFVSIVNPIESFQNLTMKLVGISMVIAGLGIGGWLSFIKFSRFNFSPVKRFSDLIIGIVQRIFEIKSTGTYYPMGIILGFLPCGILYGAYIAAAGIGVKSSIESNTWAEGFLRGMLMLFLFGTGTLPSLFIFGNIISIIGERIRYRLYKASAILMILMGLIFLYRSFN